MPVPRLLEVRNVEDGCEIVYEDIFASGRCTGLLADCINTADRNPSAIPVVRALVNQVCDHLLAATEATGTMARLDECVPDLHLARLAPGGRLDCWYTHPPDPAWVLAGQRLGPADLADRTLVAGGRGLGPAWPVNLPKLRSALAGHTRWASAITQGDVTEPNIAQPLCWLDFEHAGRNALAGDAANFLSHLLGMGACMTPTSAVRTITPLTGKRSAKCCVSRRKCVTARGPTGRSCSGRCGFWPGRQGYASSSILAPASLRLGASIRSRQRPHPRPAWCTWTTTVASRVVHTRVCSDLNVQRCRGNWLLRRSAVACPCAGPCRSGLVVGCRW